MNVGGVLNASLEAIQAGQDLLEARVAELQAVQAQLQAGQAQLLAGQAQLQAQLQDGLQQLQIAVENIGVCILLNTISPSSFIYLFIFFHKNQLTGVFPNVNDKNLLRKLSNKAASLSEPLMPLLQPATLQPYPHFPQTKSNLAGMTGPQLIAALTFYDQLIGGTKRIQYIRLATFIGAD